MRNSCPRFAWRGGSVAALFGVFVAFHLMWAASATAAQGAQSGGYVAFLDVAYPTGTRPAEVIRVVRGGRPVTTVTLGFDLLPGDKLFLTRPGSAVSLRYLSSGKRLIIRWRPGQSGGATPDHVVEGNRSGGLAGEGLAFVKALLGSPDQSARRDAVMGSRGDPLTCNNSSGESNAPTVFAMPALASSQSFLSAGRRSIFVSWEGGAAPFEVTLQEASTGREVGRVGGVTGCSLRTERLDLRTGQYVLAVTDRNGTRLEETALVVVRAAPQAPSELSGVPEPMRTLYYATWLEQQEQGVWRFEAVQRVAGLGCSLEDARDWLGSWSPPGAC